MNWIVQLTVAIDPMKDQSSSICIIVTIDTEQQCCPMMIDTDTRVSVDKGTRKATLNMATTRGSCSPVDKFRLGINRINSV